MTSCRTLAVLLGGSLMGAVAIASDSRPLNIYSIPLTGINGEKKTLSEMRGNVILVANTASQCGYTPQYAALERIHKKYQKRGLTVVGFPSNDFGGQEPGSNAEIRYFCESNYQVNFPMFSKGPVTGQHMQPLFQWLIEHAAIHDPIEWNFEKFLISRSGQVIARFKSGVPPDSEAITKQIEKALEERPGG